jgi:hypothetical protein
VQASAIKAAYASALQQTVLVRRFSGSGSNRPRFDVSVRAKATSYQTHELIGTILQGDQKVFLLVDDIIAGQMALPVTTNDKIVIRGKEFAIVNPSERAAPDGTLIVYEMQCRG